MTRTVPLALVATFSLAPTALAQRTWIVDDDGGPGVDFLQIQPAVDAAANGDLILIEGGQYAAPVEISKGLRLVAQSDAELDRVALPLGYFAPSLRVKDLPVGLVAAVSGFDFDRIEVVDCEGVVILDGIEERRLDGTAAFIAEWSWSSVDVFGSNDVRVRGHRLRTVSASTVEFVQGRNQYQWPTRLLDGAQAYLAGHLMDGVHGMDAACFVCTPTAGLPSIESTDSDVVLASSIVSGGRGGLSMQGQSADASAASAVLLNGGTIRTSNVEATGGMQSGFFNVMPYDLRAGAQRTDTGVRADPTLQMEGDPVPGSPIVIRVTGTPGHNVRLLMGRAPVRIEAVGSPVGQLVRADRLGAIGVIPASGKIDLSVTVPAGWSTGTLLHMQASLVAPGGRSAFTGSVPLFIR